MSDCLHSVIRHSAIRHSTIRSPFVTRSTSSIVVTPSSTFSQASCAQRSHAVGAGGLADFPAAGPVVGQLPHGVGRDAQLVNALPADEAQLPASAAALRPIQRLAALLELVPREIVGQVVALRLERLAALRGRACAPAAGPSRLRPCWRPGTARRPCRPAACRRWRRRWCAAC